jgi:alpha-tubulin suppressor-like RCC1 family protein
MKKYLMCLYLLLIPFLAISCNSTPTTNETTQIFLGGYHSSVITEDGKVYIWGRNMYGGLGDGTKISKSTPIEITSELNLKSREEVIQMSLGSYHSAALTSRGRLITWGNNQYGQLGDDTTINRLKPVDVTSQFNLNSDEIIIQVSFNGISSSAITSDGRIFIWGDKALEIGFLIPQTIPLDITSEFDLNPGEKIIQVSLGGYHSSVITSDGRIFFWGINENGQLGDGTTTYSSVPIDITSQFSLDEDEKIIQASLNDSHSSVITSKGRIFTWGKNDSGQLGDGTTSDSLIPIDVTSLFFLDTDEKIIQVALGLVHSSAITSEGRIFTWGSNFGGKLGDGTTENRTNPTDITFQFSLDADEAIIQVALGLFHSSAITSKGRIFTWGQNEHGQLGDGTSVNKSIPVDVTTKFN